MFTNQCFSNVFKHKDGILHSCPTSPRICKHKNTVQALLVINAIPATNTCYRRYRREGAYWDSGLCFSMAVQPSAMPVTFLCCFFAKTDHKTMMVSILVPGGTELWTWPAAIPIPPGLGICHTFMVGDSPLTQCQEDRECLSCFDQLALHGLQRRPGAPASLEWIHEAHSSTVITVPYEL